MFGNVASKDLEQSVGRSLWKPARPSNAELTAALGPSAGLWKEFIQWMADEEGVTAQEWKGI